MNALIFGCGYLGLRVGRRWVEAGAETHAVTRVASRTEALRQAGLRPTIADITKPRTLDDLPACDTILFAVGYDRQSGQSLRSVYVDGLKNVLNALPPTFERFLYISSTGVYAQNDGSWVDEDSPCAPRREGGQACLEAEQLIRESLGERAIILRLAGIYGPGRIPRAETLRQQAPLPADPDSYLNLIHVEDAADIVVTATRHAPGGSLYLVSDGHPVQRREYYRAAAQLLETPEPVFQPPEDPSGESSERRRRGSDKRIRNRKLLRDLAVTFRFPTYREGLEDAVRK